MIMIMTMTMTMTLIINGHLVDDVRATLSNKKPSSLIPPPSALRPQASGLRLHAHDYDYDYDHDYDYDYDYDHGLISSS